MANIGADTLRGFMYILQSDRRFFHNTRLLAEPALDVVTYHISVSSCRTAPPKAYPQLAEELQSKIYFFFGVLTISMVTVSMISVISWTVPAGV